MDLEQIKKRVEDIRGMAGDYEVAHGAEDDLRAEFIAYVASLEMLPSLSEKAREVLATKDIEFPRHCA